MSYTEKLESFNKRGDYRKECDKLLDFMRSTINGPVLDIGCGLGGMINALRENGVNVYGVDSVRQHLSRLEYDKTVQACGETLPFKDHSFSSVYYMHSFAHIGNVDHTIQETRRVLTKDGTLFIVTPNSQFETLVRPAKTLLEKTGRFVSDKTVTRHYSLKELSGILSEQFNVIHVSTFGKFGFQRIISVAKPKAFYNHKPTPGLSKYSV